MKLSERESELREAKDIAILDKRHCSLVTCSVNTVAAKDGARRSRPDQWQHACMHSFCTFFPEADQIYTHWPAMASRLLALGPLSHCHRQQWHPSLNPSMAMGPSTLLPPPPPLASCIALHYMVDTFSFTLQNSLHHQIEELKKRERARRIEFLPSKMDPSIHTTDANKAQRWHWYDILICLDTTHISIIALTKIDSTTS